MVALLLVLKALFFYADNGYRDPGLGAPITCSHRAPIASTSATWMPTGARTSWRPV